LAAKADPLGFVFLDLTLHLREAVRDFDPSDLHYYPSTVHYSPRGHEVVATAVADMLKRLGLASRTPDVNP
jgi:hypothetical protein